MVHWVSLHRLVLECLLWLVSFSRLGRHLQLLLFAWCRLFGPEVVSVIKSLSILSFLGWLFDLRNWFFQYNFLAGLNAYNLAEIDVNSAFSNRIYFLRRSQNRANIAHDDFKRRCDIDKPLLLFTRIFTEFNLFESSDPNHIEALGHKWLAYGCHLVQDRLGDDSFHTAHSVWKYVLLLNFGWVLLLGIVLHVVYFKYLQN